MKTLVLATLAKLVVIGFAVWGGAACWAVIASAPPLSGTTLGLAGASGLLFGLAAEGAQLLIALWKEARD